MKKSTHASLAEVAKKAGVGTTTVSRVINGSHRVSPKTLARVQRVIESLGYTPNEAARTLKGRRSKTIGLVIPSIADPFFASCAEAAHAVARQNDSLLIVTTTHNEPRAEMESLNFLIRHRTDGLLISPANSSGSELRDLLHRTLIPVVAIDRPIYDSSVGSVVTDNFDGAMIGTQHLIEHGYKRILCLTGESELYTLSERIKGYTEAVKAAGLKPLIDTSVTDYQSTEKALSKLLTGKNPPDAIFGLKNSTTIFAFEVLQKLDIAVPGQVALLGFDDFELASTVRPSISVIEQPIEDIARIAAEMLFRQLLSSATGGGAEASKPGEVVKLKTRLIRRSSCGC